ncbi:hypothetical protein L2E82_30505 [Cichorium intybus]|uniref:Uncharacterized protein n=1 Tax=Cichorium intybus TaxID=13427 RepID=A0ACB9D0J9_CICIN|nr:hypothetical protein L2E82_30505 [Cichorium intybus]
MFMVGLQDKKNIQEKESCIQRKRSADYGKKNESENMLNILEGVASPNSGFAGEKMQCMVDTGNKHIPDLFSTCFIQSSETLEQDGSSSKSGWYHNGAGTMMEDGRVEGHITSNEYESLDQPPLVGSNVFINGNSDTTGMHAVSEHGRLLSTQPSVNYNSKSLHDHVSKKDVEINMDNHVIAAANFQAVEPSKTLEHHD